MFELNQRINAYRKNMTRTQLALADHLLSDLNSSANMTIGELADSAKVSTATITRFCEALGYSGYSDLRSAIVVALDRRRMDKEQFAIGGGDITEDDSLDDTLYKISFQEAEAISDTARNMDRATIDKTAQAIIGCRRLDIYGLGSSYLAAMDLQQKLHRIGLTAYCWSDNHLALTSDNSFMSFGRFTADEFTATLSAPDFNSFAASSMLRTPPPTVKGISI